MPDGKILHTDKFTSRTHVYTFLTDLSNNLKKAYNLQKNPKWGNFEQFSSKKAFGGINNIETKEVKYISGDDKNAVIYCDAIYYDSSNGDAHIKQNFTLSKISEKWYITGMKVKSFKKQRNYTDSKVQLRHLEFSMTNITGENFDFDIEAVSLKECANGRLYTEIAGKAEYTDYNQAVFKYGDCSLYFFFGEDDKTVTLTGYKYKEEYKNLNIILNKDFEILTFK